MEAAAVVEKLITIDPEIVSGTPVFTGTRVPIKTFLDHLSADISCEEFLDQFPSVTRDQVTRILDMADEALISQIQK